MRTRRFFLINLIVAFLLLSCAAPKPPRETLYIHYPVPIWVIVTDTGISFTTDKEPVARGDMLYFITKEGDEVSYKQSHILSITKKLYETRAREGTAKYKQLDERGEEAIPESQSNRRIEENILNGRNLPEGY